MPVKKLTPILLVEKIEPVLPFWTQHLGFIKTVEVPDGGKLAFVILQQGSAEVMYQSYAWKRTCRRFWAMCGKAFVLISRSGRPERDPSRGQRRGSLHARTNDVLRLARNRSQDPAGHFMTFAHFAAPASA